MAARTAIETLKGPGTATMLPPERGGIGPGFGPKSLRNCKLTPSPPLGYDLYQI